MKLPAISQYAESVAASSGLFRTLDSPVCVNDIYGRPYMLTGGNAVIFKVKIRDKYFALKCYTQPKKETERICSYISVTDSPLLCRASFFAEELFVFENNTDGKWYDVVTSEWIEGHTLDFEITKALINNSKDRLLELARLFDLAALELLRSEWAHGDLKPENIIITPDGRIKLIDFDAMFIPDFTGFDTDETGTATYQHPLRNSSYFNEHIDDYSIAIISSTLHTLAENPSAYRQFGNSDYFLFSPLEIIEDLSEGYRYALDLSAKRCNAPLYNLLVKLKSATPQIDGLHEAIESIINSYSDTVNGGEQDHLTPCCHSGRWGYCDDNDNWVISPCFDSALEFSEGLAAVKLGDFNHFIDIVGRSVIKCTNYDVINSFSEGYAAVKSYGIWGFIDKTGVEVVKPQFIKVSRVKDGFSRVTLPDKTTKQIAINDYING